MDLAPAGPVGHLIVDRDGVLAREEPGQLVAAVSDWRWEAGALGALRQAAASGCVVSIATNQSCISRGTASADAVAALHDWLAGEITGLGVRFNGTFVCPHAPDDGCACRKPRPGLVLEAVRRSGIAPEHTVLIGDALSDAAAAQAAGVRAVLVRTGKGAGTAPPAGVTGFDDVEAAVTALTARFGSAAPAIGATS